MPKNSGVFYTRASNQWIVYLIFNSGSGWMHEFSSGRPGAAMSGAYNNAVARALDTPSWASITESHSNVIKSGLAAVRPQAIPSTINVVTPEEEEQAVLMSQTVEDDL